MLTNTNFDDIAEKIIRYAKQKGASDVELSLGHSSGFSVSSRNESVEQVEHDKGKSVDVTLLIGQSSGCASTSDFSWPAIQKAVDAAYDIANYTSQDKFLTMPDKAELAFDYPALQLSYPSTLTIEQAIEIAIECEGIALASDKRIVNTEGAEVCSQHGVGYFANSLGFQGTCESTMYDISCSVIAKQKKDMQRDYAYTRGRDWNKLKGIKDIADLCAQNALARLGAKQLSTQSMPVIFSSRCSKMLVRCLLSAISGSAIYKKSSFLVDHLGKAIFPDHVTITEKPHLNGAIGSAAFDGEGVKTREKKIIDQGVLSTYLLSTYSANQLKMTTTGNAGGVFNLFVDSTAKDEQALMQQAGRGLLVTDSMGSGINGVTGDFSLGVQGHYFENGELAFPVSEMTVAGNLIDMFQGVQGIAEDDDNNSSIQMGAVLLESMMVAGAT
jgi:PmbA protein